MYKEPHLTVKNAECNKLWYEWYELFNNPETKTSQECKEMRKKWCNCVTEFGELVSQEVKTNPRYISIRKI